MCIQARDVRTAEVVAIKKMSYSGKQSNEVSSAFDKILRFDSGFKTSHFSLINPNLFVMAENPISTVCLKVTPVSNNHH